MACLPCKLAVLSLHHPHPAILANKSPLVSVPSHFSGHHRRAISYVRASATADNSERDTLVAEFMRYVDATKQEWPLDGRRPTALLPPNTVIRVQMEALMRNDWPEDDSGIKTAFTFSMPEGAEEMLVGQVPKFVPAARAWNAEQYLSLSEFAASLRDDPLYAPVINCSDWKVVSPVIFHGPDGHSAFQAVKVIFETAEGVRSSRIYTFSMQKVHQGPYRNCWMVVGMRFGDHANI